MRDLASFLLLTFSCLATNGLAAEFPTLFDTEPDAGTGPPPAVTAAAGFEVPAGFRVQVFAAEPDIQNPIGMNWDGRGRLWVAENFTYAETATKFELGLRDRLLIFEDTDNDGRADSRKVFTDEVQMLTSVELGRGGVWLMCPPQLLFIPDVDRNDEPDGPAVVMLDGFNVPVDNYHTIANGLKWGPDGWLYGRCGASSAGRIGTPGTPDAARIPINGGLWRFHPHRKTFEVLAHGTTNPWGHDWNEYGEPFFINTVNGHLWHAFSGAHFKRPHTQDPNPRVYEAISMHADHWHWDTGQEWRDSRGGTGTHDALGGGHAHSGCMIYLADQLPAAYRGRLFTLNLHGRRMNVDRLERHGSGYLARHESDLFHAADLWFRGIEVGYGPDGGVFVLDWSDIGECHEHNGVHRQSGRIYKLTFGTPDPINKFDLEQLSSGDLVGRHADPNEWYVRQARRILVDRYRAGEDLQGIRREILERYRAALTIPQKLRYLCTLHAIEGTSPEFLSQQLSDENEHIRAWAVRMLSDHWPLDTILSQRPAASQRPQHEPGWAATVRLAGEERSDFVRLALTSMLQRVPLEQRLELARALCRSEEEDDQNIPHMMWYGMIPVADDDATAMVRLAESLPPRKVRRWTARRLAEDLDRDSRPVSELLAASTGGSLAFRQDVAEGLIAGLTGWRSAPQPAGWEEFAKMSRTDESDELQVAVRELSVLFGDGRALDEVRRIALDKAADIPHRQSALETLIASQPADLREVCESLLNVRFLNTVAVRGLASFKDPEIGVQLARNYRQFHHSERPAVIESLVSRPEFTAPLLEQMARGRIARADVSPFQARQIRSFGDPQLTALLSQAWGEVRNSVADKRAAMDDLKNRLLPDVLAEADMGQGRAVFNKACGNCHRLYGHGGQIGPDLTGSGRHNIDYLLENMVDPSAVVGADYRMSIVELSDGRVLNGIVSSPTDRTITLQTAQDPITVLREEIESISPSKLSVMPEGQLQNLSPEAVRDLFAYLMNPVQVGLAELSQNSTASE